MLRGLCGLLAVLSAVSVLPAQVAVPPEVQTLADSLRQAAACPTDVEWPELPTSTPSIFTIDPTDISDSADIARPDITVPQYAFFYRPTDGACVPVIVVQAQSHIFGHISVSDSGGGSYFAFFYDLLGTEIPMTGAQSARSSVPHFRFVAGSTPDPGGPSYRHSDAVPAFYRAAYEYQHPIFWERRSPAKRRLP